MLGSIVISFASLNSSVRILEYPREVDSCFEEFSTTVESGDYAALEQLLYGQPKLGAGNEPDDVYTKMIWDAFRENIGFAYTGNAYLLDADFARDAAITVVNIPELTQKLPTAVRTLLTQQSGAAEDPTTLMDEDGSYKADVVEQALQKALEQLLDENTVLTTHNVTVKLIHRDGHWWAVPDQTFLKTISGM